MKNKIIKVLVTGFYTGLIPFAPGTFGSLLAFPLCFCLLNLATQLKLRITISGLSIIHQELLAIAAILLLVCLFLFILGCYLSDIYIKETGRDDPKEVVIDEIAGQMLTILLSSFSIILVHESFLRQKLSAGTIDFIFLFLLPFCLFRLFDIFKPWPINWLDSNIKGGLGVMLDDFVAAIFATVMCYAITIIIVGNYSNVS